MTARTVGITFHQRTTARDHQLTIFGEQQRSSRHWPKNSR
jgi:hypothetical protein